MTTIPDEHRARRAPFIAGGLAGVPLALSVAAIVVAVISWIAAAAGRSGWDAVVELAIGQSAAPATEPVVVVVVALGVAVMSMTIALGLIAGVERWAGHPRPVMVATIAPLPVAALFAASVGIALLLLTLRPPQLQSDTAVLFAAITCAVAAIPLTAASTWVTAQAVARTSVVPHHDPDEAPLDDPYELET